MRSEKNFWTGLKRQLDKLKPKLHYERIENKCSRGTPDVLICYCGWYVLIELKVKPNKLSNTQQVWHKLHTRAEGNVVTFTYDVKTKRVEVTKEGEFLFDFSWVRPNILEVIRSIQEYGS